MTLGLTQPLTEMSTRNISWDKGGRCVGLTKLPPSRANCLEVWEPKPPVTLWPAQDCNGSVLPFTVNFTFFEYMEEIRPGSVLHVQGVSYCDHEQDSCGPEVDSACNINEYQEYFKECKDGRYVGLTYLPPSCADYIEILEPQPPGTLRVCPGL